MAKVNKYGRQIFLSRAEIASLRGLVEREKVNLEDGIDMWTSDTSVDTKIRDEELAHHKGELKTLEGLVDKLWYYVSSEGELNG